VSNAYYILQSQVSSKIQEHQFMFTVLLKPRAQITTIWYYCTQCYLQ